LNGRDRPGQISSPYWLQNSGLDLEKFTAQHTNKPHATPILNKIFWSQKWCLMHQCLKAAKAAITFFLKKYNLYLEQDKVLTLARIHPRFH